jgi:hypothetical protein
MSDEFHKPTMFGSDRFDKFLGGEDPAHLNRVAHDTAHALLSRVRANPEPDVVDRLVTFTDLNGIDAIAELWAHSGAKTLPGALWRIYLIRLLIRQDAESISYVYQRGVDEANTIDPLVAGAIVPTGPAEITELADRILRGLFEGDFAVALDRAAAFCRVASIGCTTLADDLDPTEPERASELTTRALRFSKIASELTSCARLWRAESLE